MKKFFIFFFKVIFIFLKASVLGQITRQQAIDTVLFKILSSDTGKVDIYVCDSMKRLNDTITLANGSYVVCPFDSNWVFYIDNYPLAQWTHPCQFLFFNSSTGADSILTQKFFPDSLIQNFTSVSRFKRPPTIPV